MMHQKTWTRCRSCPAEFLVTPRWSGTCEKCTRHQKAEARRREQRQAARIASIHSLLRK
jgi:predicted ATP-dependent serine protease